MPRTDYDETWEKQDDGSMKLLKRVERIVSDKEIAREQVPERMQKLKKQGALSFAEVQEMVRAIANQLWPDEDERP